jgi:hypothetical protein
MCCSARSPSRRDEDQDRPVVSKRARARRTCRTRPRVAQKIPIAPGLKLKSTYTDALSYVNPDTHRVHTSHALAATTTGRLSPPSRTCKISRSAPRRAARSGVLSWRRRGCSSPPPIFADRAAIAGRDREHRGAQAGVPRRPRFHAMTASEMFGVPVKGMPGKSAGAPGDQFRIIYAFRRSGSPTSSASRAEPAPTSRNISSASRASATTWRKPKRSAKRTATCSRCSAAVPLSRHCQFQPRSAPSTNAPR